MSFLRDEARRSLELTIHSTTAPVSGLQGGTMKLEKVVIVLFFAAVVTMAGCGQEYFSTPEKTLSFYNDHRAAGSAADVDAMIRCFTKADQEWWNKNYRTICDKLYGIDCPVGEVQAQATVWTDRIEPYGPKVTTADSVETDDKAGKAVVKIGDDEYEMVKEGYDWKFNGFFGADAELQEELKLK
jgi:hypothetical protein